jgi:DTW domain-containing protein YfiP
MPGRNRVPDLSRRCPRCAFPPGSCLCAEIPRLATRTRLLVVRHAQERARTTSTVRWAALALERCEVLDHALRGAPLDLSRIPSSGAVVLFPSAGGPPRGDARAARGAPDRPAPARPAPVRSAAARLDPRSLLPDPLPHTLVVLDGSWGQARRMLQRIPPLRTMPRLSLPVREGERLRRPTVEGGMSTLEAIAAALELLGDTAAARALEELHRVAIARSMRLRWASGRAA